jgi:AhpD family alkylhydroperoxidase
MYAIQAKGENVMFLPDDVNELFNKFENAVYSANAVDKKTKQLIALSCSMMIDCKPCINYHYKEAIKAGATKEEIAGTLAICMSVNAGSKRAKYTQIISDLEHNKVGIE